MKEEEQKERSESEILWLEKQDSSDVDAGPERADAEVVYFGYGVPEMQALHW